MPSIRSQRLDGATPPRPQPPASYATLHELRHHSPEQPRPQHGMKDRSAVFDSLHRGISPNRLRLLAMVAGDALAAAGLARPAAKAPSQKASAVPQARRSVPSAAAVRARGESGGHSSGALPGRGTPVRQSAPVLAAARDAQADAAAAVHAHLVPGGRPMAPRHPLHGAVPLHAWGPQAGWARAAAPTARGQPPQAASAPALLTPRATSPSPQPARQTAASAAFASHFHERPVSPVAVPAYGAARRPAPAPAAPPAAQRRNVSPARSADLTAARAARPAWVDRPRAPSTSSPGVVQPQPGPPAAAATFAAWAPPAGRQAAGPPQPVLFHELPGSPGWLRSPELYIRPHEYRQYAAAAEAWPAAKGEAQASAAADAELEPELAAEPSLAVGMGPGPGGRAGSAGRSVRALQRRLSAELRSAAREPSSGSWRLARRRTSDSDATAQRASPSDHGRGSLGDEGGDGEGDAGSESSGARADAEFAFYERQAAARSGAKREQAPREPPVQQLRSPGSPGREWEEAETGAGAAGSGAATGAELSAAAAALFGSAHGGGHPETNDPRASHEGEAVCRQCPRPLLEVLAPLSAMLAGPAASLTCPVPQAGHRAPAAAPRRAARR
jgi:hypothetical protein